MIKIGKISIEKFPLVLAPMENITGSPFRLMCKTYGADILYSEFIASDALVRNVSKSIEKIQFEPEERPIGIQIFGNNPDVMAEAGSIVAAFKPDFIDLNFGCPVRKVVAKGGGAALLNDLPKMIAITNAVVKAVDLPVTVKTRLGWDHQNMPVVTLAESLQDVGAAAIAIHGRTKAQMYGGKADWTLIGHVKNNPRMHIPVFGNGDIDCPEKALEMRNSYGVDGLMIGRATSGSPWLFTQIHDYFNKGVYQKDWPLLERIDACRKLLFKSIECYGERKGIISVKKHYAGFFKSLPRFKPIRLKLVTSSDLNDILRTLDDIENSIHGSDSC